MKIFSCLLLFTLLCHLPGINGTKKHREKRDVLITFNRIIRILPNTYDILKDMMHLWKILLKEPNMDIRSALFQSKEQEIMSHLRTMSSKISDLEQEVKMSVDNAVVTILQAFPKIIKLELYLHDLTLIINQINFADEQLKNYLIWSNKNSTSETILHSISLNQNNSIVSVLSPLENISSNVMAKQVDFRWIMEKYTMLDFATWATAHSFNSLLSLLKRMNDIVVNNGNGGLFDQLLQLLEENSVNFCNLKQSPHQTLYNLYNTIAVAELKGNAILQFSYMILKMYQKGDFIAEANIALQSYEKTSKQKIETVLKVLSVADRSIYRCDPKQYVEDVTYTKLTKLLQGYIENEVNLNPYGTCGQNCAYYTYTEYDGCFKNQFCAKQPPCSGKVINCRYVDSDMHICRSTNSERRYEWVEYENGKILGNKGVCERKNLFQVDSWWRYLFWHCSYCLCLCDDSNVDSERYFNLRDVTSDIKNNKIVTGVRIVKSNKIIHFQIQQGVLNSLGFVNKTSLSWKPVDNYTVEDEKVRNNVDYYTMSWLDRAVDTDEVSGPPQHVVTGLRFRKIGTHLNLEVRVTPFNFTTGQLFSEDHSYWIGNDNTEVSGERPRTEILLNNPDIPIRNGPHSLNSKHNQYIQFQASSFDTDAGQTTVPYLDSQPLTSHGFPLSGIGLIHRGRSGSGGFIAPKLISYDFTPHLRFNRID